jgi:hypothetical protein
VLINRPAHNSGLAKAAIEICAKIEHPLGSLRQATKRYRKPKGKTKYRAICKNS